MSWRVGVYVLIALIIGCATTQKPSRPTRRGCLLTISESARRVLTEPLVIVGEKEGIDEDGKPIQEWWVWYPQRPKEDYLDANGNFRAVNVPKSKVLFAGETRLVKGLVCKCPI